MALSKRLTISARRASAGTRVGGASLCLSAPSRTSANLFPSPFHLAINLLISTVSWESVSHRRALGGPAAPSSASSTSDTAPTMRSNRCLAVIHCDTSMIACRRWLSGAEDRAARRVVAMLVLPVASVPWRTRFRAGAACGCGRQEKVSNRVVSGFYWSPGPSDHIPRGASRASGSACRGTGRSAALARGPGHLVIGTAMPWYRAVAEPVSLICQTPGSIITRLRRGCSSHVWLPS